MAQSAENLNLRIKNLRNDAKAAARAALTHSYRLGLALERFQAATDDLEMFTGNRKAVLTDEDRAADARLFEVSTELEHDRTASALDLLDKLFPVQDAQAEPAPAQAADGEPADGAAKRARKVKDAPSA